MVPSAADDNGAVCSPNCGWDVLRTHEQRSSVTADRFSVGELFDAMSLRGAGADHVDEVSNEDRFLADVPVDHLSAIGEDRGCHERARLDPGRTGTIGRDANGLPVHDRRRPVGKRSRPSEHPESRSPVGRLIRAGPRPDDEPSNHAHRQHGHAGPERPTGMVTRRWLRRGLLPTRESRQAGLLEDHGRPVRGGTLRPPSRRAIEGNARRHAAAGGPHASTGSAVSLERPPSSQTTKATNTTPYAAISRNCGTTDVQSGWSQ
jgi:hypothetical protein